MLKFKQLDWMKNYTNLNTEKRTKATYKFEKNFFKLMINSVYDKTMENERKRIVIRLVNNEKDYLKDYLKHVSKSTFISQKFFD